MLDSFVNGTTVAAGVLPAILYYFEMIIDAVDVLQIIQIVMVDVDLFRYRFGNGVGSAN